MLKMNFWTYFFLSFVGFFVVSVLVAHAEMIDITTIEKESIVNNEIIDDYIKYSYEKEIILPANNEILEKRTKHSQSFSNNDLIDTKIFGGEAQFYQNPLTDTWYQIDYATTTLETYESYTKIPLDFKQVFKNFFITPVFADSSFFSDAVDGYIQCPIPNTDTTWATIHDHSGSGCSVSSSSASDKPALIYSADSGTGWRAFNRGFIYFSSSAIPDNDTITSSTLSIYVTSHQQTFSGSVRLVESTGASDSSLTGTDYAQCGTTALANDLILSALTNNAYNHFTLNATGLTKISKTGVSKFCLRIVSDATNSEPSETAADQSDQLLISFSEQTGTNQDPILTVTHSTPPPDPVASSTISLTDNSIIDDFINRYGRTLFTLMAGAIFALFVYLIYNFYIEYKKWYNNI